MRKHSFKRCHLAMLLALAAAVSFVPAEAAGATISGTAYQSDGTTPLTGKNIYINAYTGSPCGAYTWAGSAYIDTATGAYTIPGLPAGTYYLWSSASDDYISEWWAAPLSVPDCSGAQATEVTEGQAVTGRDFQLARSATISGTVYQSDGTTPLTGKTIQVLAYTGSPCSGPTLAASAYVSSATGTYKMPIPTAGTYYLRTNAPVASENCIDEWWASPQSARDCSGAGAIEVAEEEAVTGKDFQLDPGATISGTVYESEGTTPLTGKSIFISAVTGSPCGTYTHAGVSAVDTETGTYTIPLLTTGTYYLRTSTSSYIVEWWASPQSVLNCSGAGAIEVVEGDVVTGKDFQLEPGASISGTVYESDGTTPLTGKSIYVIALTGSPCGTRTGAGFAYIDTATGTYTIPLLPAGTYYLQTEASDNYISEWWASPDSVRDCAGAQPVVVTEGQAVTGKHFQLSPGATISGTVYQSDGTTPLTGQSIRVDAYTGSPCGAYTWAGFANIDTAAGTYTIPLLPAGTYYLQTGLTASYLSEWWASPQSVRDCAGAQPVAVTEGQAVAGKHFQLDPVGALTVTISPQGVRDAGAQWRRVGTTAWFSSGVKEDGIPVGAYSVEFKPVTGWTAPPPVNVTVGIGQMATASVTYVQQTSPVIQVTPGSLNFGYVPAGSTKELTLTVRNAGVGTLTGNAITDVPFIIASGGSYSLGADESQVVTVRYQPTNKGPHNGTVAFTGGYGAAVPVTGKTEKSGAMPWLLLLLFEN